MSRCASESVAAAHMGHTDPRKASSAGHPAQRTPEGWWWSVSSSSRARGFQAAPVQGKLSLGVMGATRSAGERARNASAETSGTTAAAGGMVTASKRDGEGERCRLGVQASVRRIPMTSPMRTEPRPAGSEGGLG